MPTGDVAVIRPSSTALEIPRSLHDAMVDHCLRERPCEACGILSGRPPRARAIHPLGNRLQSAVRYDADPRDLGAAIRSMRANDHDFVAIYHSHPSTQAVPSKVDLAENYYGPLPRIIVSLAGPSPVVRVWQLDAESFTELAFRVIDG